VATVLAASLLLIAVGCGGSDEGAVSTTTVRVERPPSLEDAVAGSETVVEGEVTKVRDGTGTVKVDAVLHGKAGATVRVRREGAAVVVGERGVWVLGEGDPAPVLLGPPWAERRAVQRVLEGRPAVLPPPTAEAVRALAGEAEVVVFGRVSSTDGVTAEVVPEEVLKGTVAGVVEVVRPEGATEWEFPTKAPGYGTLFLRREGGRWVVLNPQDPHQYGASEVRAALG
jgi:hypothetical protein